MTTFVNGIYARTLNATLDCTSGEKIILNTAKIVCYYNDFVNGGSWGGNKKQAVSLVDRCIERFSKYKNKSKYFVCCDRDEGLREGQEVWTTPENFNGSFICHELDDYEKLGTLHKDGYKWVILTDLEKVETIRRSFEFTGLAKNTLDSLTRSIGGHTSPETYKAELEKEDAENGSMRTRGHGFCCS